MTIEHHTPGSGDNSVDLSSAEFQNSAGETGQGGGFIRRDDAGRQGTPPPSRRPVEPSWPGRDAPPVRRSDDEFSYGNRQQFNPNQVEGLNPIQPHERHALALRYKDLERELKGMIVDQDHAVERFLDTYLAATVGLTDPAKPMGVFLLPGPTGTGKTYIGKTFGRLAFGTETIRIDCSEYQTKHQISRLTGSPPGYVNSEFRGVLHEPILDNPDKFFVVQFDEIEKANDAVNKVLLQILDDGRLTNGQNQTALFNRTLIVLTSNLGTKELGELMEKRGIGFSKGEEPQSKLLDQDAIDEITHAAIKKHFSTEFRNRLDAVIPFRQLSQEGLVQIAEIQLDRSFARARQAGWFVDTPQENLEAVARRVVELSNTDEFNARDINRTVRHIVEMPLAKELFALRYEGAGGLTVPGQSGPVGVRLVLDDEGHPHFQTFEVPLLGGARE